MTDPNIKTNTSFGKKIKMKSKDQEVIDGLALLALPKDQEVIAGLPTKDQENTKLKLPNDEKEKANFIGSIASLHIHSLKPGNLMEPVQKMLLVAGKGILNNPRYFET